MKKLEELKAALEAATPGEWTLKEQPLALGDQVPAQRVLPATYTDGGPIAHVYPFIRFYPPNTVDKDITQANAAFIALSHNLMPQLLEAVDLLETLRYSMSQYDDGEWFLPGGSYELIAEVDDFMEKLK